MNSRFWDVYRDIRSVIQKPDDVVYILHTSIGAITVQRFVYRGEASYVSEGALTNMGESGSRAFPNSSSPHFPFEIRMKSAEKNGQIKFNRNLAQNLF